VAPGTLAGGRRGYRGRVLDSHPRSTDGGRPERLKIGLVTDCYLPQVGGIEMQVHDLALNLTAQGHEVVVITPTRGAQEVDGIRVRRMDVPLLPFNVPFTRATFRLVSDLLEAEKVDVAHFHGGIVAPVAMVGAHDAQSRRIPTVVTIHCLWSYATPAFRLLDRWSHWGEWPVVLSAVSEVAARPMQKIAHSDVLVLPNGIDDASWDIAPLPHDRASVTIVGVMRLAPRKRPLHLLKMMRRLRERTPSRIDLTLRIIGEGPERGSLEKYIRNHDLESVVELTGRLTRDEIRQQFASADIFVAPANLESFGIAALEARCAGLPVVAKSRTGIREFIEHEQEGLLADSDADMVDQLLRLVVDPELRNKIATRNRETSSPVDWAEVVQMNVNAYRQAIELVAPQPARR
jgi:glycosyltransferase involved in cell wall biosynthesis